MYFMFLSKRSLYISHKQKLTVQITSNIFQTNSQVKQKIKIE